MTREIPAQHCCKSLLWPFQSSISCFSPYSCLPSPSLLHLLVLPLFFPESSKQKIINKIKRKWISLPSKWENNSVTTISNEPVFWCPFPPSLLVQQLYHLSTFYLICKFHFQENISPTNRKSGTKSDNGKNRAEEGNHWGNK